MLMLVRKLILKVVQKYSHTCLFTGRYRINYRCEFCDYFTFNSNECKKYNMVVYTSRTGKVGLLKNGSIGKICPHFTRDAMEYEKQCKNKYRS